MTHYGGMRVTWTICPACGGQLAIGWDKTEDQTREVPVAFNCVHHCELTISQAVKAATGPSPGGSDRGSLTATEELIQLASEQGNIDEAAPPGRGRACYRYGRARPARQ